MPKKTLTISEAHALWGECLSAMEALRAEFPCDICDGTGNANTEHAGDWEDCKECRGHGFLLPDEEDE